MNLHLLSEYSSHNLGDAVIYETLAQLAAPLVVRSRMAPGERRHARGLQGAVPSTPTDAWLSVGGDVFNNARPALLTRRFACQLLQLAVAPPARCFAFGQSVPASCRGLAFGLLARAMRRLAGVTVRDEASHQRLREAGVAAELSWDIAFAYRPVGAALPAACQLLEQAGVDPARCVLISVREFDAMYPHDNERFVTRIAELCRLLRGRGHQPALLLQADAAGSDSDRRVAARIGARVADLPVIDPFAAAPHGHPVDALLGLLALARGAVAVRYHTAVLRLLAGLVPYSLHYSVKGRDLARRLRLPGTDLDDLDPAAAIAGIEASFERDHDPWAQHAHVTQAFGAQLAQALGEAVAYPVSTR